MTADPRVDPGGLILWLAAAWSLGTLIPGVTAAHGVLVVVVATLALLILTGVMR